jgi:hypothetical protein
MYCTPINPIVFIANVREIHRTRRSTVLVPIESYTVLNPCQKYGVPVIPPNKMYFLHSLRQRSGFFPGSFLPAPLRKEYVPSPLTPQFLKGPSILNGIPLCVRLLQEWKKRELWGIDRYIHVRP